MDPVTVGALITAAGSIIATLFTNQSNKEVSRESQDFSEKMQDKQNEYEKPINQVKRLDEAGITPISTFMGNGSGLSLGHSANPLPAQFFASQNPLSNLADIASSRLMSAQTQTENESRQAKLQKIQNENNLLLKQIEGLQLSNDAQTIINQYIGMREQIAIDEGKSRIHLNYAESANFRQNARKSAYEIESVLPQQVRESIARENESVYNLPLIVAKIKDTYASAELKGAEKSLTEAQTDTEGVRQAEMSSQIEVNESQNELLKKDIDNYVTRFNAEMRKLESETGLSEEQTWLMIYQEMDRQNAKIFGVPVERWTRRVKVQDRLKEHAQKRDGKW